MKTSPLRFVVLIPHRDSLLPLRTLKRRLFAEGLSGAFSFPPVVPLALTSRPLDAGELRALAASLRKASLEGSRDGRITAGKWLSLPCPQSAAAPFAFSGPALDIAIPPLAPAALLVPFSSALLCAALAGPGDEALLAEKAPALPDQVLFFRAAAAANMVIRPLGSGEAAYSFEWKIGKPCWLPSPRHVRFT